MASEPQGRQECLTSPSSQHLSPFREWYSQARTRLQENTSALPARTGGQFHTKTCVTFLFQMRRGKKKWLQCQRYRSKKKNLSTPFQCVFSVFNKHPFGAFMQLMWRSPFCSSAVLFSTGVKLLSLRQWLHFWLIGNHKQMEFFCWLTGQHRIRPKQWFCAIQQSHWFRPK